MSKFIIIELALLGVFLFPTFTYILDEDDFNSCNSCVISQGRLPTASDKRVIAEFVGEISAYNVGIAGQTDEESPCIGAFNENLCKATDLTVANNYYKKGTIVYIEGVGNARVADRMNSRYGKEHFDIAMKESEIIKAKIFGRKHLKVLVYAK